MSQPSPPDNVLVNRYLKGDQTALGELLSRHQNMLFNTVLRMVSNRDDAAEVTQEAMMRVVQNIDRFRQDSKFTTWATRIAMNCAISRLRRRKLRRMASLDMPMGHDEDAGPMISRLAADEGLDPADRVAFNDRVDLVHQAIDLLDEPFKSVLVLRDIHGMEYAQIAETLDIAKGTVKSRLFRARLAMREIVLQIEAGDRPAPGSEAESEESGQRTSSR